MNRTVTALAAVIVLYAPAWGQDDAKEKAKKEAVAKELKSLEGDWVVVSLEGNGQKVDVAEGDGSQLSCRGDSYTQSVRGVAEVKGTLVVDPSRTPKTMDLTPAGKGKPVAALYLYELKGDELRLCGNYYLGRPRPAELKAQYGSNLIIFTYRRVKPKR
jgi:uncharacterized protein (TIGR03067 family)